MKTDVQTSRAAPAPALRDHGGNIDSAIARYGEGAWIDLSTGINRRPWPVGTIPPQAWHALPTQSATDSLIDVAAAWFGCDPGRVLPVAGASAAIQALPRLLGKGHAAVLTPSYNEHAASLQGAGWDVTHAPCPNTMAGADLGVVVNPNNPDGREWTSAHLTALAGRVRHLIVDESFADPRPDLSLVPTAPHNVTILRSFGKFWGLAGVRLGFVIAAPDLLTRLRDHLGPWTVGGPALAIGTAAMADHAWADAATVYHAEAALRLDRLVVGAGWTPAGGTHLFRLYATPDAAQAQDRLARAQVWTRRFPYSDRWLRLGIPGGRDEWDRLSRVLAD